MRPTTMPVLQHVVVVIAPLAGRARDLRAFEDQRGHFGGGGGGGGLGGLGGGGFGLVENMRGSIVYEGCVVVDAAPKANWRGLSDDGLSWP
jgi:hypothetical protein